MCEQEVRFTTIYFFQMNENVTQCLHLRQQECSRSPRNLSHCQEQKHKGIKIPMRAETIQERGKRIFHAAKT